MKTRRASSSACNWGGSACDRRPNIPPKSNQVKPCFSERLYRERNLIERFFSELKHFRPVATRYDKLATNFLAMVQLASMRLWLRAYESRTVQL